MCPNAKYRCGLNLLVSGLVCMFVLITLRFIDSSSFARDVAFGQGPKIRAQLTRTFPSLPITWPSKANRSDAKARKCPSPSCTSNSAIRRTTLAQRCGRPWRRRMLRTHQAGLPSSPCKLTSRWRSWTAPATDPSSAVPTLRHRTKAGWARRRSARASRQCCPHSARRSSTQSGLWIRRWTPATRPVSSTKLARPTPPVVRRARPQGD